jgi:hypothetical protein
MRVEARGHDGRTVRFVVEHSADGNTWQQLTTTTARVSSGVAIARVRIAHPAEQHRTDSHFAAGTHTGQVHIRFQASLS